MDNRQRYLTLCCVRNAPLKKKLKCVKDGCFFLEDDLDLARKVDAAESPIFSSKRPRHHCFLNPLTTYPIHMGMAQVEESHSSEACYVFVPGSSSRPVKRRKIRASHSSALTETLLPALFDGKEDQKLATSRFRMYRDLWTAQEHKLQDVLKEANAETIDHVCQFLDDKTQQTDDGQLPAGFISAGLATSSSGSTLASITERYGANSSTSIVSLSPSKCPNLKTALKSIIQSATNSGDEDEDEDDIIRPSSKQPRLLNYDLQILHNLVIQKSLQQVIIHIQESEAFDGLVLSDFIDVLSCWLDRIPFVLVFEIATSIELFQEKLSRRALRLLKVTVFEAKSSTQILDLLFRCATSPDETRFLWLGSNASKLLLDRQTEHIQSARGFVTAMQYMYMLHFYQNPLSALIYGVKEITISTEHIKAIRNLPSFRRYINDLIDEEENTKASNLLKDDEFLISNLESRLQETRDSLNGMFYALEVLRIVYSLVPSKTNLTWSNLYIKAMSGDLVESTAIRELSLSIKKLPSDTMLTLVKALAALPTLGIQDVLLKLETLLAKQSSGRPLRTEHDTTDTALETTIVGQRVTLSKSKKVLSAQDTAYSRIVSSIDLKLREFLTRNIIFPKELIFNEILVFDSKAACRDILGPSPRQAMERALFSPHDYLACECCESDQGLQATQPTSALVYQLFVESGALINIADMWTAYQTIMAPEGYEDDADGEALRVKHKALFFRSLAELKYLGFVRSSRRKADHVMKVQWRGL